MFDVGPVNKYSVSTECSPQLHHQGSDSVPSQLTKIWGCCQQRLWFLVPHLSWGTALLSVLTALTENIALGRELLFPGCAFRRRWKTAHVVIRTGFWCFLLLVSQKYQEISLFRGRDIGKNRKKCLVQGVSHSITTNSTVPQSIFLSPMVSQCLQMILRFIFHQHKLSICATPILNRSHTDYKELFSFTELQLLGEITLMITKRFIISDVEVFSLSLSRVKYIGMK